MNRDTFFSLISEDLEKVQKLIEQYLSSHDEIIDKIGRYISSNSGKKVRPSLLLVTGRIFGDINDSFYRLAAMLELLHTATLVHDDIIDEADTRRSRPSVNAVFGDQMTVLMGDWLYMTAFQIAVKEKNLVILDVLIDMTKKMVEGELIQLNLLGKANLTIEENLDIAARKTAYLFSACTRIAGIASKCPDDQVEKLFRIGQHLGLAFQLVDDVLDFTAEEKKLGKPIMNDLREGKVTLPVIYLLQENVPEHRRMVETILHERGFNTVATDALLAALQSYDCIPRAMAFAQSWADKARKDISDFPPSRYRDALEFIADFIIDRKH